MEGEKLSLTLEEARKQERLENAPKEALNCHILELSHLRKYIREPVNLEMRGNFVKRNSKNPYYCPKCEKEITFEVVKIGTTPFDYFHCDCGYEYVPTWYCNL